MLASDLTLYRGRVSIGTVPMRFVVGEFSYLDRWGLVESRVRLEVEHVFRMVIERVSQIQVYCRC
jgi:hypothetical protein